MKTIFAYNIQNYVYFDEKTQFYLELPDKLFKSPKYFICLCSEIEMR